MQACMTTRQRLLERAAANALQQSRQALLAALAKQRGALAPRHALLCLCNTARIPCVLHTGASPSRQTLHAAFPEERGALAPRQRLLRRHRASRQPHAARGLPLRPAVLAAVKAAVAGQKP